jgi:hypothetical protein
MLRGGRGNLRLSPASRLAPRPAPVAKQQELVMTMFCRVGRFAGCVGAVLAAGLVAGIALATRASAVTVLGKYYEDYRTAQCNAFSCAVTFAPVPAGKILITTGVSCKAIIGTTTATINYFRVGGLARYSFFAAVRLRSDPNQVWQANDQMHKIYGAAARPAVDIGINESTAIELQCSLSGELKP